MFSPVLVKKEGQLVEGLRIFGGEVFQQDGEFPILYGYGQTYGRVKSGINETISEGRPIFFLKHLYRDPYLASLILPVIMRVVFPNQIKRLIL